MKKETENKQLMEENAYRKLGEVYVKIPKSMLNTLFHPDEWQQKIGKLYLFLYHRCAFQSHTMKLGRYTINCKRGEYAGSCRSLSKHTGITSSCIHRILKSLEQRELIRMEPIPGGSRIYIYGYDLYNTTVSYAKRTEETSSERARGLAEWEEKLEKGQVYAN